MTALALFSSTLLLVMALGAQSLFVNAELNGGASAPSDLSAGLGAEDEG